MAFVTFLFTSFGALGYACFGEHTVMPVTLNVHTSPASGALLRLEPPPTYGCSLFHLRLQPPSPRVAASVT